MTLSSRPEVRAAPRELRRHERLGQRRGWRRSRRLEVGERLSVELERAW